MMHYFSGGCGGQYKNKFNFVDVCGHADDFQFPCDWIFFSQHPTAEELVSRSVAMSSAQITASESDALFRTVDRLV